MRLHRLQMAAGMDLSLRRQEFRDERQRCSEEKNGWSSSAVEVPSPLGLSFCVHKRGDYTIYTEVLGRIFGSHLEFLSPF